MNGLSASEWGEIIRMWTPYITFNIICSFACALLAEKKGRSSGLGCLSGLLFGIFGLIYYLVVGKSTALQKAEFMRRKTWEEEFEKSKHD